MRIAMMGTSDMRLVSGAGIADLDHQVICVDMPARESALRW